MSEGMHKVLIDKAEGEAYDKIKVVDIDDGGRAYGMMYKWFTDVSELGLLEQARRLMHPEPVKREEELADGIDQWLDNVTRLEAHGTQ